MKTRVSFWLVYALLWLLAVGSGCQRVPAGNTLAPTLTALGGGSAAGSGATLTPPPAAAEPSEQHAVEETIYAQPEAAPEPSESLPTLSDGPHVVFPAPGEAPAVSAVAPAPPPAPPPAPRPLYHRSETFTRLGAQQEVAPMLKQVSGVLGRLNKAHWLGILGIVASLGGILHSAGNRESGYPAVWLKILGGSILTVVMGDAVWFWVLVGLAFLLYLGQKLGVLRVP